MDTEITRAELSGITESMLPEIISGQIKEIESLEISIKNAVAKAEEAKALASSAKEKQAGLFQKKEAIELLQAATISLAEAEAATVEAQGISFECQKRIGEITKYLFALGCTNMAANRSVVRELRLILEGASGERLDELAKQEIVNVIRQLKAQEDILNKQNELSARVSEQEKQLSEQTAEVKETKNALILQAEKSEGAEKTLMLLGERNRELEVRLKTVEAELLRRRKFTAVAFFSAMASVAATVLAVIGLLL